MRTPASSIAASTAVSGSSIDSYRSSEPRSASRSRISGAEAAHRLGAADERRGRLLRSRLRLELEAVLGREVVDGVVGSARLDQVGGEQRVVGRREGKAQRLGVVRDDLGVTQPGRRLGAPVHHDDLAPGRHRAAAVDDGDADLARDVRELALAPGHRLALELWPLGGRQRFVERVDAL